MVYILHEYGYSIILLAVFAENLGLPIPSFPLILAAAAFAAELHLLLPLIFIICTLAALSSDGIWYALGRTRGRPILRSLCSLSLSPDSCVNRTEHLFQRYGVKSLLVAKFIPGLNTVGPPLAGMLKVPPLVFVGADFAGIALWAGSALTLGRVFRTQVEWLTEWLAAFGRAGGLIVAVAILGWLVLKWVQRYQFSRLLERSRISPAELKERLERGAPTVIVDLRSDLNYRSSDRKVAGAIWIPPQDFHKRYAEIPLGFPVAMYCT